MTAPSTRQDAHPDHESISSLRTALRGNAAFSALSGAAVVVLSGALPGILGTGSLVLYAVIGVLLLAYALRLWLLARRERIPRKEGLAVVAGDAAWVLATAVIIGTGILSTLGAVLVGITTVVVGAFALWQARALPPA